MTEAQEQALRDRRAEFIDALAAWHGGSDYAAPNPAAARAAQALNKAIADQPPYWERCACRGSGPSCGVPTCERHQRGALSVSGEAPPIEEKATKPGVPTHLAPHGVDPSAPPCSCQFCVNFRNNVRASDARPDSFKNRILRASRGEAPPKFCTKCYAPWNSDGYCPRGCGSAPPPEKEPRPDMTTLRGANLGDTTGAAPPKEPPAPMEQHQAEIARRLKRMAAPAPEPPAETRSVEDSLESAYTRLMTYYLNMSSRTTELTCNDIKEALRLYRSEKEANTDRIEHIKAMAEQEINAWKHWAEGVMVERNEARNERDARRDRKVLCADLEARIDAALALVPQGTTEHCKQLRAALRGGKVERD